MKVIHCQGFPHDSVGTVYIGRPSPFGNPYIMHSEADRFEVIEKYKIWFAYQVKINPEFRKKVLALRGCDLACWCAPKLCHGDVIISWLETHKDE